ncbi:MAG: flagellar motor protein MotB [Bacilli bacterium]
MSRRKKKHHHEEHVDETWLIPYSDLVTLLLALFIVLYASSNVDSTKFKQIAESFSTIFTGGTGVLTYPEVTPPEEESSNGNDNSLSTTDKPDVDSGGGSSQLSASAAEILGEVDQKLQEYIKDHDFTGKFDTKLTADGLLITLQNEVIFDSGSATIKKEQRQTARELSKLLVTDKPMNIIVSGHTDNVPIKSNRFSSNWHLSALRAVNFMEILLENKQLDPRKFSARGYGEFQPIADNATKKGKQNNRRVEILIQPPEIVQGTNNN